MLIFKKKKKKQRFGTNFCQNGRTVVNQIIFDFHAVFDCPSGRWQTFGKKRESRWDWVRAYRICIYCLL